jgi:hypothetical protein
VKPPRRQPRQPQQTDRQKRSEAYEAEWLEWKENQPPARKQNRVIRGQDVARGLEIARDVTGDPRFRDALDLWKSYELDREFQRKAALLKSETFGNPDAGYLVQVKFCMRRGVVLNENGKQKRRRLNGLEACEYVVAKFKCDGATFKNAVERLRQLLLKT